MKSRFHFPRRQFGPGMKSDEAGDTALQHLNGLYHFSLHESEIQCTFAERSVQRHSRPLFSMEILPSYVYIGLQLFKKEICKEKASSAISMLAQILERLDFYFLAFFSCCIYVEAETCTFSGCGTRASNEKVESSQCCFSINNTPQLNHIPTRFQTKTQIRSHCNGLLTILNNSQQLQGLM